MNTSASETVTPTDYPNWTRMGGQYQNFQEFQRERPVSEWRMEEAMFRLLGRGYSAGVRVPL